LFPSQRLLLSLVINIYTLKYCLLVLILFALTSISKAQSTKTIQLKPILKNGKHYFYGSKRVNSAYALQIPLEGIMDDQVNLYFKRFKRCQNFRAVAYIPALLLIFYSPINTNSRGNTFLGALAAGVVADITLNRVSHYQMGKAIDLYNISILQRSAIGLRLEKSNKDVALCLGFRLKF
jgi:hypothetical protein